MRMTMAVEETTKFQQIVSLPEEVHQSLGEGLLDVSGAAPDCETCVSHLPSADLLFDEFSSDDECIERCIDDCGRFHRAFYHMNELDARHPDLEKSKLYAAFDIWEMRRGNTMSGCETHMDGGSQATTCHDAKFIFGLRLYKKGEKVPALRVADKFAHYPKGEGQLCIPCEGSLGYKMVPTFYTPCLPITFELREVARDTPSTRLSAKTVAALSFVTAFVILRTLL